MILSFLKGYFWRGRRGELVCFQFESFSPPFFLVFREFFSWFVWFWVGFFGVFFFVLVGFGFFGVCFFCGGRGSTPSFFLFLLISQIWSNCFTTENPFNLLRHISSRSAERLSLSHHQTILGDKVDKHSSSLQKTTLVVDIWPLRMPTFILLKDSLICKL